MHNEGVCVVGNPESVADPLPFSEYEVLAIDGMLQDGRRPSLIGEQAQKESVLAGARGARVLHLACHGGYSPADPLASGLRLAAGERVSLRELMTSRDVAGVRVVIASACESAVVDISEQPDEAIGFPAGFLQAGAAAYVGSLWSVSDVSTSLLMIRFHEVLWETSSGSDLRVGAALRHAALWLRDVTTQEAVEFMEAVQAQVESRVSAASREAFASALARLSLLPNEARPFSNPTHWAPFVLVGREG
jgi:CHAT domain-containing protein